jgi:hypothetical protein
VILIAFQQNNSGNDAVPDPSSSSEGLAPRDYSGVASPFEGILVQPVAAIFFVGWMDHDMDSSTPIAEVCVCVYVCGLAGWAGLHGLWSETIKLRSYSAMAFSVVFLVLASCGKTVPST